MRNLKMIAVALVATLGVVTTNAQTKKVNTAASTIEWTGKKVTGEHKGTISLKDGSLVFKKNKLTGGAFTVNMSSITVTDLKAGEGKEKLEGHLKADDFFGTDKFATSNLVFKTITAKGNNVYTVTADLKIKDKTNPVTFDITVNGKKATALVKIDRTKFDIKYGSGSFFDNLGDKAISDEFELNVTLAI